MGFKKKKTEFYADSKFVKMGSENVINKSYMQKSLEKLQYLKSSYSRRFYRALGQYYALSRTIVGRARIKASDGRPAELDNL